MDLNRLLSNSKRFFIDNSGTILTIGAASLGVLAVVEAVRATSKAKDIIDDLEYERFESMGCPEDENVDYHLTNTEKVKNTWHCYIWTMLLLSGSIACGVSAHVTDNKKIQAATLAYGSLLETYNTYQEKMRWVLKDKDIREVNHRVMHDIVERDKSAMPDHIRNTIFAVSDDTKVLFRDIYSAKTGSGYFKRTMEEVRRAEGRFNRMMMDNGRATINDWYDCLNLGHSELGDYFGWDWAEVGPLFAVGVPDDIDMVEDVAVVSGIGLARDQYSKFFEMPKKLY